MLELFATLYRQILQKCCTCRNNPHPGTRICLMPVAGPKGHSVYLQDCSYIGTGCCHTFLARSLSRFFLTSHSSSVATVEIVLLRCGPNSDERRRCSGISLRASTLCRFWCTTPFSASNQDDESHLRKTRSHISSLLIVMWNSLQMFDG